MINKRALTGIFLALILTFSGYGWANGNAEEEAERVRDASSVLSEIMNAPDSEIPRELLDEATAIAVIPHAVKGAFMVGGEYGKGVVVHRGDTGDWSAPSFISLGGASFGFQVGATATDYILVFTNREGLEPLLKGKVKLGGDASIAAGPVGRRANASTDVTLNAAIYSYSRSKGAFAGVSLDGAVLTIDDSANENAYGSGLTGRDILLHRKVSPNEVTEVYVNAVENHID